MDIAVEALEQRLGYRFRDRELLVRALTHRSWLAERGTPVADGGDNEQLEFLGDSILGFIASESLVLRHPGAQEGQLSQWKAQLVSSAHLYRCALALDLGRFLRLGRGEERNGGRERKTVLANALEAVMAAIHVDGGIEAARRFTVEHILGALDSGETMDSIGLLNYKGILHERAQALGLPIPEYTTVETSGPDHAKVFTVEARIGESLATRASGPSKKAASQHAAEMLMGQLNSIQDSGSTPAAR
ncbi:MAG TPA: ribonuclease III [Bryobacteraceae bacterium]|jgi:ribonuclease-3|nr:ribonuclease III [Bryobacteraceae bacterium]